MADEIAGANTIRVYRDGRRWRAAIGPPGALDVTGPSALKAVHALIVRCAVLGWCFDDTWKPHA